MRIGITIMAAAMVTLFGMATVNADPNADELQAFRLLAPDWSKTCGGYGSALSPDGNTLLYISHSAETYHENVWAIHGVGTDYRTENLQEPWPIDIQIPASQQYGNNDSSDAPHNIDWSPNGKRAAVVLSGRLYVLEDFDYTAKTAKALPIAYGAQMIQSDGKPSPYRMPLESPRWSPNGDKIAFLKKPPVNGDQIGAPNNLIAVVDSNGVGETIVARDANDGSSLWSRPWSPDGKHLVYASTYISTSYKGIGGIRIASLDGSTPRTLTAEPGEYPSWSNRSDQIAYSASYARTGLDSMPSDAPSIIVINGNGKHLRRIAPSMPTREQVDSVMIEVRKILVRILRTKYSTQFTAEEIEDLEKADITSAQIGDILMVAEARLQAPDIGGEFRELVERMRVRSSKSHKNSGPNAAFLRLHAADISKAVDALPDDEKAKFQQNMVEHIAPDLFETWGPLMTLGFASDKAPVWSQDDSKVAFIRQLISPERYEVIVADIQTGDSKVMFSSSNVDNVQWANNGSLLADSRRDKGYYEDEKGSLSDPGYPEIWLLQPRTSPMWSNWIKPAPLN